MYVYIVFILSDEESELVNMFADNVYCPLTHCIYL